MARVVKQQRMAGRKNSEEARKLAYKFSARMRNAHHFQGMTDEERQRLVDEAIANGKLKRYPSGPHLGWKPSFMQ